MSKYSI